MSVRGSLRTMAIADVFAWIERRGLAGELTLDRANLTRRFQTAAGAITGASSTDPSEYLGQILLNAGAISEEQLREAYASPSSSGGVAVGKLLALDGMVSEAALRAALELKIRESFYDAMGWDEGSFQFDPQDGPPKALEIEVRLPLAGLLAEGAERAALWRELRAQIPSDETRFFVPDKSWLAKAKPGSPSALILGDVERGLSVREICLARHSLPFPIYQRLGELMQRGIVKIDRRAARRDEPDQNLPPPALIEAARGRAKGGDRAGALALAKKAVAAEPDSQAVRQAYGEIERSLFAELSRTLLAKYRVPRLLRPREELLARPLSAEERYLVERIDGRWDLLSLMRVSPLREVEALIVFRQLVDKGVIALE